MAGVYNVAVDRIRKRYEPSIAGIGDFAEGLHSLGNAGSITKGLGVGVGLVWWKSVAVAMFIDYVLDAISISIIDIVVNCNCYLNGEPRRRSSHLFRH